MGITSRATVSSSDDRTLVAAAQSGDRVALDALLRRHYDRVHAICRRIAGGTRDADDAAQEAMISIVRGLPKFDGRSAFTTWLYRIATNAALDEVRRRKRRPGLHVAVDEDGFVPEEADPLAHKVVEAASDRMVLDTAFGALAEEFRAAVVLRDVCDLDYAEIAEVLEIPVGTVKSRIARGRSTLADNLRRGNGDTEAGNRGAPSQRPSATGPEIPAGDPPPDPAVDPPADPAAEATPDGNPAP